MGYLHSPRGVYSFFRCLYFHPSTYTAVAVPHYEYDLYRYENFVTDAHRLVGDPKTIGQGLVDI